MYLNGPDATSTPQRLTHRREYQRLDIARLTDNPDTIDRQVLWQAKHAWSEPGHSERSENKIQYKNQCLK
jgi:hypothetical protein